MTYLKQALVLTLFFAATAQAGECHLKISREACPGKDVEAYKPYNGKKETEETSKKGAADEKTCKDEAEKAAKIVRKGTLTKKTVVATFDGKPVAGNFTGTAECK